MVGNTAYLESSMLGILCLYESNHLQVEKAASFNSQPNHSQKQIEKAQDKLIKKKERKKSQVRYHLLLAIYLPTNLLLSLPDQQKGKRATSFLAIFTCCCALELRGKALELCFSPHSTDPSPHCLASHRIASHSTNCSIHRGTHCIASLSATYVVGGPLRRRLRSGSWRTRPRVPAAFR